MSISTSTFELEVQLSPNEQQYTYYVVGVSAVSFPILLGANSLKLSITSGLTGLSTVYTLINEDFENQADFLEMLNTVFIEAGAPYRGEFTDDGLFTLIAPEAFAVKAGGPDPTDSDAELLTLLKLTGQLLGALKVATARKARWQIDFTPPSTISGKSVFVVTKAFSLVDQLDVTTEYVNFFLRCSSWSQPCNTYNGINRSTERSSILSKYVTNETFTQSSPVLAYIPDGPHTLNFEIEQIESSHAPVLSDGLKFVIMLEFQNVAVKHFYD